MSNSIYKISGQERRNKKKELAKIKYSVKMFWYWEDVDRVYGGGLEKDEAEEALNSYKKQIEKIELELKELL
jgi:hypothetical protein